MQPPQGLRFLARNLLIPAIFIFFVRKAGNATLALVVSTQSVFYCVIGGAAVFIVGHAAATSVYSKLQAKSMTARLAPKVKGNWPGNIDVLRHLLEIYETGYLGDGFYGFVESLGPVFNLRLLWTSHLFTVSPEHIQIILATDFSNYVKGKRFRNCMDSVLGDGVFNSDGEMWSAHRAMTRPYFARDRVRHFEIFDRHAETAVALIKGRLKDGHAVDFQDLISRFTMDAATEFLFGTCVNSLSTVLPYPYNASPGTPALPRQQGNDFSTAYGEAMLQIAFRERVGWSWPLLEIFTDRTAKPMETVAGFIDPIIHNAVKRKKLKAKVQDMEFEGSDSGDSDTLLDELLKTTTNPKLLRDEILNILLAGRDGTRHGLTMAIYFLAMYPRVLTRLRQEILNIVGPSARPSYGDIKEMKYLRAVINESLRLYPPVPFNVRETVKATTWPSPDPKEKPIYIPAGPSSTLDFMTRFNGGPRICLGQQFAYNEMSFVIIRLLQNFSSISLDVEACPPEGRVPPDWAGKPGRKGVEKFRPQAHLTMYTLGGLWVRMEEAS
ncbi:cytochrome P450 [Mycena vitilis]|nr:cytochrome P450 [Mycena vitilis]